MSAARTCRRCAVTIKDFRTTAVRKRQFCSRTCREGSRRTATIDRQDAHAIETACKQCGGFIGEGRMISADFCSEKCKDRYYHILQWEKEKADKKARLGIRRCTWCGGGFEPWSSANIFCSAGCSRASRRPRIGVLVEPRSRRKA